MNERKTSSPVLDGNHSKKIFHHYFDDMRSVVAGLKKKLSRKAIHRFRVDVKKINALFLVAAFGQTEPLRFPKDLRDFYHSLGELRNLQLIESRIGSSDVPERKLVRRDIEIAKKKCRAIMPSDKRMKEIAKQLSGKIGVSEPFALEEAIDQQQVNFRATARKPRPTDEELHESRKALKHILYLRELFASAQAPSDATSQQKLTNCAELLGLYNDTRAEKQWLEKPSPDEHTRRVLRIWYAQLLGDRKKIRARLRRALPLCLD